MKRTIIYVFGPKRLANDYFQGKVISLDNGGWLKIGQTQADDNEDKWNIALKRANQECRTGLPEVCRLYQVYEYPKRNTKEDDKVRRYLTTELYQINSSRKDNLNKEDDDIKAGREFVYNLSQKQVRNAFAMYERQLILEAYSKESEDPKLFKELMACVMKNNQDDSETFDDSETSDDTPLSANGSEWTIWNKLIEKIGGSIKTVTLKKRNGSQPINIPSNHKDFSYYIAYNPKRGLGYVEYRIIAECGYDKLRTMLMNEVVRQYFKPDELVIGQDNYNPNKNFFRISTPIEDMSEDELVEWYADTTMKLYNAFEMCEEPILKDTEEPIGLEEQVTEE